MIRLSTPPPPTQLDLSPASRQRHQSWLPVDAREWLVVLTVVGTGFLNVSLPANLVPVDLLFAAVTIAGGSLLIRHNNSVAQLFRRALPWMWLLLLSCALPLFGVGFASWALDDAARDLMAILSFFTLLALLVSRPAVASKAAVAFLGVAVFVAVSVLTTSTGLRSAGATFGNPNYPGHFLAAGLILVTLVSLPLSRGTRAIAVIVLAAGLYRTGSFSAFLIVAGAIGYTIWRYGGRFRPEARVVVRLVVLCLLSAAAWSGATQALTSEFDAGAGVSSERLARSSSTRLDLWTDGLTALREHPLGLGPGGAETRLPSGTELHSDPLAFFVENGLIGLVAVTAIVLVLWRTFPREGITRVLMAGLLVGSFFREAVNFRHLWVVLAVGLALDWRRQSHTSRLGSTSTKPSPPPSTPHLPNAGPNTLNPPIDILP